MYDKALLASAACLAVLGIVSCSAPAAPESATASVSKVACDHAHERIVDVADATTLASALADAQPGDLIRLAPGTYRGGFGLERSGTAADPIVICGPREAQLEGEGIGAGYVLHLEEADHVVVDGLTLTRGKKGIVLDGASHNVLTGLLVHTVGEEAVQIRRFSSDNAVSGSELRDTGRLVPAYGDGVHLGSSRGRWAALTGSDTVPDRSDRNRVLGNVLGPRITGEAVDAKEGTAAGIVRGNVIDGVGTTNGSGWVVVKGNGYRIEDNAGSYAAVDGFQVRAVVDGWGRDNVFGGNRAAVNGPGFGFHLGPGTEGNLVRCDNNVAGAGSGFANVGCGTVASMPDDEPPPVDEVPSEPEPQPEPEPEPEPQPEPEPEPEPEPQPEPEPEPQPEPPGDTPPPAPQLDPSQPPSGNFDLTRWYLTLPTASTVQPAELSNGYAKDGVFYTDPATGGMAFRCPNLAGTTTNSSYSRTELREMRAGGGSAKADANNWKPEEGGTLRATLRVDRVSRTGDAYKVGRVVIGQIHGVDSEPIRLYYDKKPNQARGRIYGGMDSASNVGSWTPDIVPNGGGQGIALGETFGYEIRLSDVRLTVTIRTQNGDYTFARDIDPGYRGENQYFKAGVYNQNNTGESDDYVQATFFALDVTHP